MVLKIGDIAPDFTLYNTAKQPVTLSALKGKPVVLLFFPLAFTSTCTAELCAVRDDISNYSQMDAEVFGISVDTPHTLLKFKEEQHLNFELLSDFNKTVSPAYGSMYDSFTAMGLKGVSKRSAFVVNKEGFITYAEVLDNASEIPDLAAVKAALKPLNNMTMAIILILIVLGLILILLELFVTPGFVTGLLGGIAWLYALYKIYNMFGTTSGHLALGGLVLLLLASILIAVKSGVWDKVSLNEKVDSKVNELPALGIGNTGHTLSALRPMGKVSFEGVTAEASTMGEHVESGAMVEIIKIENNKIYVKQLSI